MKNRQLIPANLFFVCIILVMLSAKIYAQPIAYYSFSSSNRPYESLQNGIELGDSFNRGISFSNVPLGFTFNFGGIVSSEIAIHTGGYIKVGAAFTYLFDNYSPLTDARTDDFIISPLGGVLYSDTVSGQLSYLTVGIAPNRVFVADWKDYESSFSDHSYNFQVRIYETNNKIEFHYGVFEFDPSGAANFLQAGLRGARSSNAKDINQRSVSDAGNDWNQSIAIPYDEDAYVMLTTGLLPENGLLYTWNPPASCSSIPVAGIAVASAEVLCQGQELIVSLEGIPEYTLGTTYTWEFSADGTSYTSLQPASYPVLETLFSGPVYYRAVVACDGNSANSTPVFVNQFPVNTYATLPFTESFESNWESRCGTPVPNSTNWSANGTYGTMAWKQEFPELFAIPQFSGKAAIFQNAFEEGSSSPDLKTGDLDLYVNLSGTENYSLSFDHINSFTAFSADSLVIYLSSDGGDTFTRKAKFKSNAGNPVDGQWNKKYIPLGVVNSSTCVIRIRAFSDGFYEGMAIDNVEISVCSVFTVEISTSSETICRGASATITANGADSFLWNNGQTGNTISVSPFSTERYSIIGVTNNCSSTDEIIVYVDDCTGLGDIDQLKSDVIIMPNPTNGETTLHFTKQANRNIYLYDISGKLIQSFSTINQNELLDMKQLQNGFYFLKVESQNTRMQVVKIVKN